MPGTSFLPNLAEVRQDVLDAMARQPISHRSAEFHEIFAAIQRGLRDVFRTARPVYVATASGTAMMEAAVRCAPRGRLLVLANGSFAERFARIARDCARDFDRYEVTPGDVPDPDAVGALLNSGRYSAVTVVHNETSTGALADIAAISRTAHNAGVAVIVDSVSGIGGARFESGAWEIDCVVSASQKALGLPPGISFAVASENFLRGARDVAARGLYLDLLDYESHARNSETPTTPSMPLIFALARQLSLMVAEGMEARWCRHEAMRTLTEAWVARMREESGAVVEILARPGARSPTVTVMKLPAGVDAAGLVSCVASRGYKIGLGHGALAQSAVRIGHMGNHSTSDLDPCLTAIMAALQDVVGSR